MGWDTFTDTGSFIMDGISGLADTFLPHDDGHSFAFDTYEQCFSHRDSPLDSHGLDGATEILLDSFLLDQLGNSRHHFDNPTWSPEQIAEQEREQKTAQVIVYGLTVLGFIAGTIALIMAGGHI